MLSEAEWIVLIAVLALVAIAAFAMFAARKAGRRHELLKRRFGPEYDRAVEERGSVGRAERELLAREKRVRKQRLTPLAEADRARFSEQWRDVQARFVDDPSFAVQDADELIIAVMRAQGYDLASFEQRVADLSVDHADMVDHYRAAHDLAEANREGRADTEALRQAFVHYRALFSDLLEAPADYERRDEYAERRPGVTR
jgi:hypothetical protein